VDIDGIISIFTDLLKMCKFETLSGELQLSWFDKSNITHFHSVPKIEIDFNLNDEKSTYGRFNYDYCKNEFMIEIEHYKGTIIKENLVEFTPLHELLEKKGYYVKK